MCGWRKAQETVMNTMTQCAAGGRAHTADACQREMQWTTWNGWTMGRRCPPVQGQERIQVDLRVLSGRCRSRLRQVQVWSVLRNMQIAAKEARHS